MPILENCCVTNPMNIAPCKMQTPLCSCDFGVQDHVWMAHLRPNREQDKLEH